MKDLTIDYALRSTWQAVARMYNEQAKNFGSTMAVGFTLLSIDPKNGTPSTALGPKMERNKIEGQNTYLSFPLCKQE